MAAPDPVAQLARAVEDRADFGRRVAACGDVGGAERVQELQLLGVAFGRLCEVHDERQSFRQVADRLDVRRPLPRPQPRLQPVADALLGQARLGEVMGEQLRPRLGGLRELRFQHLGDPPVELLSLALDQRVVQGILEQRVLEDVAAAGRPALRVQDFSLNQLCQLRLERRLVQCRDGGQQFVAELAAERRGELRHFPLALHPVQPGHHQVLERGRDLASEQRLAARAARPSRSGAPDSCTIFVNSSTNSGTPPVRS